MNTLDGLLEEDGVPFIRHYLVDFTASLGSGGLGGAKRAWEGNETLIPGKKALQNMVGFGIYTPAWMRATYPGYPAVGRFGAEPFDPERWTTNHQIAPFANRLPDDEFWAAKQVMAFTDEDIQALVSTGGYSDPQAVEWMVRTLIERRNRIGQAYFEGPADCLPKRRALPDLDLITVSCHPASTRCDGSFDNEPAPLESRALRFEPRTVWDGRTVYGRSAAEPDKDAMAYVRTGGRLCRAERPAGKAPADPRKTHWLQPYADHPPIEGARAVPEHRKARL
jgi:hypothetical protein